MCSHTHTHTNTRTHTHTHTHTHKGDSARYQSRQSLTHLTSTRTHDPDPRLHTLSFVSLISFYPATNSWHSRSVPGLVFPISAISAISAILADTCPVKKMFQVSMSTSVVSCVEEENVHVSGSSHASNMHVSGSSHASNMHVSGLPLTPHDCVCVCVCVCVCA